MRLIEAVKAAYVKDGFQALEAKEVQEEDMGQEDPRGLASVTSDVGPAVVEVLMLLAVNTLVLARPRPTGINKTTTPTGPYVEIHDALVALMALLSFAAGGKQPWSFSRRVFLTSLRISCTALSAAQWQVDRCMAWRTNYSPPPGTEGNDDDDEDDGSIPASDTSLDHIEALVQVSTKTDMMIGSEEP